LIGDKIYRIFTIFCQVLIYIRIYLNLLRLLHTLANLEGLEGGGNKKRQSHLLTLPLWYVYNTCTF